MRTKRTPEEEQTRQLKIISYQLAPMAVLFRVAFYLWAFLMVLGLLSMLFFGMKK